jgi:hypothetical protein
MFLTKRTPPSVRKLLSEAGSSSKAATPTFEATATPETPATAKSVLPPAKRLRKFRYEGNSSEEHEEDEISDTMDTNTILSAIKESSHAQMSKIDELSTAVSSRFTKVEEDIAKVSSKLDHHDKDIDFLKRHVNDMEQEKLASDIEITGVPKADIELNKQDVTAFARKIIASFDIQFDPAVVQHAFVRTVEKANLSIIVVKLSSIEAKTLIMKKKRESINPLKIFFDNRLTNFNRALFTAARRAAKEAGGKAYVSSGRVFIVKNNDKRRITSFDDLEKFKSPTVPMEA